MTCSVRENSELIIRNIKSVVVAPDETIRLAVLGLLGQGHVLVDDFPGVGKTLLAKSLAGSIRATFKRIQFTPDLLPTDITGGEIYDQRAGRFNFFAGPVFGNIILADEINRATPRTQSALLEAMGERQVSCDGVIRPLPELFFVIATQNQVEFESTFPLPYAQLDRFMLSLNLGYPGLGGEVQILERNRYGEPSVEPVATVEEVVELHRQVCQVEVSRPVMEYIARIVQETRSHPDILTCISPRGSVALLRAAQCQATMNERNYVTPDDVKVVAEPVMRHRLIFRSSHSDGLAAFIGTILDSVLVPL
ncbi:AAA family ATPase [Chloroflexota bacterium]